MRPVAWFPLRAVLDRTLGPKPYYLMMGTAEPEGQICDFTMLRVYTWSVAQQNYETAFVQNGLCGRLPVEVTLAPDRERDVYFRFQDTEPGGISTLAYRMQDTIVRPVQPAGVNSTKPRRRRPRGA
jgi:hypothetical protein